LSFKHANDPASIPTTENGAALKFILENGNFPQPKKADTTSTAPPASTGAGAKWFVKGGSFQFRIATDFALSHANVVAPSGSDFPPVTLDTATPQICSRPMHVSSAITSTMTITIREKSSGTIVTGWQKVTFTPKSVPAAIWAAYDINLDPISTRDPGALLTGDSGARVDLAMGVALTAPPPILAVSFIPVFNATTAAKFGILDFRIDKVNGTDWILKPVEATQTEYLPAPLSEAQRKETSKERWSEVQNAWDALRADTTKGNLVMDEKDGVLAQLAVGLGWDQNRPQDEDAAEKKWQLKGALPSKLIADIESAYLALPRIAVVN
jgi:hypothetical protein